MVKPKMSIEQVKLNYSIEKLMSQLFDLCPRAEAPAGLEEKEALGTRMQFYFFSLYFLFKHTLLHLYQY